MILVATILLKLAISLARRYVMHRSMMVFSRNSDCFLQVTLLRGPQSKNFIGYHIVNLAQSLQKALRNQPFHIPLPYIQLAIFRQVDHPSHHHR
jgi:hypothetical protein